MLDLLVAFFERAKIHYVMLLVGTLTIFFACFAIDPSRSSLLPVLLPVPHYPVVGLGALLLAVGIFTGVLEKGKLSLKRIDGDWTYSVKDSDPQGCYAHRGIAEVIQDGHRIQLDGFRKHMSWPDKDGNVHEADVDMHWHTSWGSLDDDGVLRYEYDMPMAVGSPGGRIMAYARIQISRKERRPKKMIGTYYMLPPFGPDVPNARWGTIFWEKVSSPRTGFWQRMRGS